MANADNGSLSLAEADESATPKRPPPIRRPRGQGARNSKALVSEGLITRSLSSGEQLVGPFDL
jgi:hypothetical protein